MVEIIFDLVFAVAVASWAENVARNPHLLTYVESLGYLLPIWWIWLAAAVYALRFGEKSPILQALALLQVLGIGVMSTELLGGQGLSGRFALGYIGAHLGLLALYALAARRGPRARAIATAYLVGLGCGTCLWVASLLLPAGMRMWAWGLGLGVEFAVPWLAQSALRQMPLDGRRVPDRVGTFTSLVLAVSVEGIVRGLAGKGWTASTLSAALLSFVAITSLWWIYAARVNRADWRAVSGSVDSGQRYLYCHFLIVFGVGTSSLGIRVVQANRSPDEAAHGLALLAAGIVLWIAGMVLIRQVVLKHRDGTWYAAFVAVALLVPIVAAFGASSPLIALAVLVALVLALVFIEERRGLGRKQALGGWCFSSVRAAG